MSNVVDFGAKMKVEPAEKQVWTCPCGNQTFCLYNDSTVECGRCGEIICDTCADVEGWRKVLPPHPESAAQDTAGTMKVFSVGDVELARSRVWGKLERWKKDNTLEFVYGGDVRGATHSWVGVDNEKDRQYLLDNLREFTAYVEGLKFDENAAS